MIRHKLRPKTAVAKARQTKVRHPQSLPAGHSGSLATDPVTQDSTGNAINGQMAIKRQANCDQRTHAKQTDVWTANSVRDRENDSHYSIYDQWEKRAKDVRKLSTINTNCPHSPVAGNVRYYQGRAHCVRPHKGEYVRNSTQNDASPGNNTEYKQLDHEMCKGNANHEAVRTNSVDGHNNRKSTSNGGRMAAIARHPSIDTYDPSSNLVSRSERNKSGVNTLFESIASHQRQSMCDFSGILAVSDNTCTLPTNHCVRQKSAKKVMFAIPERLPNKPDSERNCATNKPRETDDEQKAIIDNITSNTGKTCKQQSSSLDRKTCTHKQHRTGTTGEYQNCENIPGVENQCTTQHNVSNRSTSEPNTKSKAKKANQGQNDGKTTKPSRKPFKPQSYSLTRKRFTEKGRGQDENQSKSREAVLTPKSESKTSNSDSDIAPNQASTLRWGMPSPSYVSADNSTFNVEADKLISPSVSQYRSRKRQHRDSNSPLDQKTNSRDELRLNRLRFSSTSLASDKTVLNVYSVNASFSETRRIAQQQPHKSSLQSSLTKTGSNKESNLSFKSALEGRKPSALYRERVFKFRPTTVDRKVISIVETKRHLYEPFSAHNLKPSRSEERYLTTAAYGYNGRLDSIVSSSTQTSWQGSTPSNLGHIIRTSIGKTLSGDTGKRQSQAHIKPDLSPSTSERRRSYGGELISKSTTSTELVYPAPSSVSKSSRSKMVTRVSIPRVGSRNQPNLDDKLLGSLKIKISAGADQGFATEPTIDFGAMCPMLLLVPINQLDERSDRLLRPLQAIKTRPKIPETSHIAGLDIEAMIRTPHAQDCHQAFHQSRIFTLRKSPAHILMPNRVQNKPSGILKVKQARSGSSITYSKTSLPMSESSYITMPVKAKPVSSSQRSVSILEPAQIFSESRQIADLKGKDQSSKQNQIRMDQHGVGSPRFYSWAPFNPALARLVRCRVFHTAMGPAPPHRALSMPVSQVESIAQEMCDEPARSVSVSSKPSLAVIAEFQRQVSESKAKVTGLR